jgi:hypothetical protein
MICVICHFHAPLHTFYLQYPQFLALLHSFLGA